MHARISKAVMHSGLGRIVAALALGAVVIGASNAAVCQERKILRFDGDTPILLLTELRAILAEENGTVLVKAELPRMKSAKETSVPDVAEGDVVLRLNGKKIASVADLRKLYEAAKPGDEMKLGLGRGDKRFIVPFVKADPDEASGRMIIRTGSAPADTAAEGNEE